MKDSSLSPSSRLGGAVISDRIVAALLQELRTGRYADADRLPAEVDLAAQLGVSRTVIRDALSEMERAGYIERVRGIGTVVHPVAGEPVAVFDTTAGVFRAVLFPEQAPQAYDNFVGLVQAGYYNGLTVTRVEQDFVVEAGQGADGKGTTIWNGSRYPAETTDSLHHYSGALCMGTDASGELKP